MTVDKAFVDKEFSQRIQQNLASKHSEIVGSLKAKVAKWNALLPKQYSKTEGKG